ncbi:MAG: recombinase family protein [Nitrospirae bacterium]|nr:recombinase family protein [Nitrospirota bacterium]
MMIAAIYARKSTEERGVSEDQKSVTRQIEHATAYALTKGWTVSEDHCYSDDGISGAEFVKRPGFLRLMNALKPKPPFQILIMSEESRLGREQIQTAYALQQITDAGVRVFYYLTDQERKLDTALDKMMGALTGFASEMEREKTGQRVHDKLLQKVRAGHVVGCNVFGYDNVDVPGPDGTRQYVVRRINPAERAIVLRIFEMYCADGIGIHAIAKALNDDGIPPPRGDRRGWAGSCVRAILLRPLYRGIVVWNKTKAITRGGTSTSMWRRESEWETIDAPDLRIVMPDLWARVEAKFARARAQYVRTPNGQLISRPSGADLRSQYLLSGLAQCAICGGSIVCQLRRQRVGKNVYMCAYHHGRGKTVCTNDLRINQGIMDSALLHALNRVLDEKLLEEAVARALAEIRAGQTTFPDQRVAAERTLSLIEARLRHLVEAIATGRSSDAVFTELHKEEAAKKACLAQLDSLNRLAALADTDGTRIERALAERVADLKSGLGRHIPQTRQLLRKLIPGRIVCTPFDDARGRGYLLSAVGTYAGLLGGKLTVKYGGGEGGI